MRKNQVKGLINDLLDLSNWKNPLEFVSVPKKIKVNLLKKQVLGTDDDDLHDFYHEKIDWFQERVRKLDGFKDFQKAIINVIGFKEKVEIIFKQESFQGERVFGEDRSEIIKRLRKK